LVKSVIINVNGQEVEADDNISLIAVLKKAGINLPTACYHPDLSITGSCRLCLIEVEGYDHDVPACKLHTQQGLSIKTDTPRLETERRFNLSLLAEHLPANWDGRKTEFGEWLEQYDVEVNGTPLRFERDVDPHPSIKVDMNKCILCTRCVRACEEIQGRFVWGVANRSEGSHIVAGFDTDMLNARCESCGACAVYCPTGALLDRKRVKSSDIKKRVTTTCPYCGVGCNFDLLADRDNVVHVDSNPKAPVNGIHLCVKGRYGIDFVNHTDRLTTPKVRQYLLENKTRNGSDKGAWIDVSWGEAIKIVSERFSKTLLENSGDRCAVMSSAKCTNEENYLMQKFARQVLGTHNIDHCARLCHSSTVAGLKASLGSGAMTNTMQDIAEQANAIFVIGSNTTEQHPVFGSMLRHAVNYRSVPLIVADPRAIELTENATLHLRHKPGTDIALINGLMQIMLKAGWYDSNFIKTRTEGFDEVAKVIENYSPNHVAKITGVTIAELEQAAELLATNSPMAVIWAMGITQHTCGINNVLSLANLQLMLGNLGIAGGGVNPLRGQNNVQGACDMGALPNVFPGYQSVADPQLKSKFATVWALDNQPCFISEAPGATVTEMVDGAGNGNFECLYILGENALMTDPNLNHVRKSMAAADFVVLQEIFPSETSEYADILLPGASFAEKDGTYTNTERRIQRIREAISSPGDARPDWWITSAIAKQILKSTKRVPTGNFASWDYANASSILDEIAAVTPSYAGVSFARLDKGEQLHWPVLSVDHPGTPILHINQCTHGNGIFHAVDHTPPAEECDDEYPLVLTTGRVIYHWHGTSMTRRAETLQSLCPQSEVEISAHDASVAGIAEGESIRVISRRGETLAKAWITERVSPGLIFGNFHFPDEANINNVTNDALDPKAKIPEYKVCAVRIELGSEQS
jgi:formate dehydrogenase major subunit/formate dehydrogenase alpha subunit